MATCLAPTSSSSSSSRDNHLTLSRGGKAGAGWQGTEASVVQFNISYDSIIQFFFDLQMPGYQEALLDINE